MYKWKFMQDTYPYSPGLTHWLWNNHLFVPRPMKCDPVRYGQHWPVSNHIKELTMCIVLKIQCMDLLPDTGNCGLRMRRECRNVFPAILCLRSRHASRHVPGSLTSGFCWRGKRSRYSQRMPNPQFYVSGKRPMCRNHFLSVTRIFLRVLTNMLIYQFGCNKKQYGSLWIVNFRQNANKRQPTLECQNVFVCALSVCFMFSLKSTRCQNDNLECSQWREVY